MPLLHHSDIMTASDNPTATPAGVANRPVPSDRHLYLVIAIATILMTLWMLFVRDGDYSLAESISLELLSLARYEPWIIGVAVQELMVPLFLLFLFSRTPLFRRVVDLPVSDNDLVKLAALFVGFSFIFAIYRLILVWSNDSLQTLGFVLVLIAAMLGGWRVGLVVGIVNTFFYGLIDWFSYLDDAFPFELAVYFEWYVLKSLVAISAIWLGVVVGAISQLWGGKRFILWRAITLGIASELALFLFFVFGISYNDYFAERLLTNLLITSAFVGVFILITNSIRDDEARRVAEAAQLELAQVNLNLTQTQLALTQAELRALHAQINPHFFFNSLNTIRYFIRVEPNKARDLLTKLSSVFQRALSAGEFIPLREELQHVSSYLALEKARLEEHLNVVWTNLAQDYMAIEIPTLVIQPLVENAVLHGIAPKPAGGTIHIVLNRVGPDLLIQISDDGVGFDKDATVERPALRQRQQAVAATVDEVSAEDMAAMITPIAVPIIPTPPPDLPPRTRPSIGLSNVDERLRMIYGEAYRLNIESELGRGTRCIIRIPLNHQPAHS